MDNDKQNHPHQDHVQGHEFNISKSQGPVINPTGPVTQNYALRMTITVGSIILIAVTILLTFGGPQYLGWYSSTRPTPIPTATPLPTATPIAFSPAQANESLIIITEFDDESQETHAGKGFEWRIADQIEKTAQEQGITDIRVERLQQVLHNREQAQQVGKTYKATLVLWGIYDELDVKPRIERIKTTTTYPFHTRRAYV